MCEAWTLMSVTNNLVTPRTGDVLVAATQDFISAAYMISHKDTFYTHSQFTQVLFIVIDDELYWTVLLITVIIFFGRTVVYAYVGS